MNVHPLKWQCTAADGVDGTLPYSQLLCNTIQQPTCAGGYIALLAVIFLLMCLVCTQIEHRAVTKVLLRLRRSVYKPTLNHSVNSVHITTYLSYFKSNIPLMKIHQWLASRESKNTPWIGYLAKSNPSCLFTEGTRWNRDKCVWVVPCISSSQQQPGHSNITCDTYAVFQYLDF